MSDISPLAVVIDNASAARSKTAVCRPDEAAMSRKHKSDHPIRLGLLAAVMLAACAASGRAANLSCPTTLAGHRLGPVSVFDGPPADLADLVPEQPGQEDIWTGLAANKHGTYLVCHYIETSETRTFELPPDVTRCTAVRTADNTGHVSASCE
jgi:hypothetical protein